MATQRLQFTAFSRLLHWTMAAMILTMLCIGVAMVASLNNYHVLVSIHRPLGITILILVVVRFVNRLLNPPPPFPATMSHMEGLMATASEFTMYGLMFVLPLVGWGMLSAARYPIVLFGAVHLPFILPHDAMLYCGFADGAHPPCIPLFPDVHRSLWGDLVSHADRAGRNPEADGAIANSYHLITNGMTVMGAAGNDPNSLMDRLEIIRPS